jgi:hypothetical protein
MNRTKIKAVEIVLFVCLLVSCFVVPRFITSQLLSGETVLAHKADMTRSEKLRAKVFYKDYVYRQTFPEGGWFEQVIRVGLIGLTVFCAFRIAKRIDRGPEGEDSKKT